MIPKFTTKQGLFIEAWAQRPYRSQAECAALIRVKPSTVSNWKQEAIGFWEACEAARRTDQQMLQAEELDRLRGALPAATEALIKNLAEANPYVRAQAAVYIADRLLGKAPQVHEVSGPGGGPIQQSHRLDLGKVSDDDLDNLERIIAHATGNPGGESPP